MPNQIMGYYSSCKEKLLKDFDRTSALMKDSFVARYSEKFTSTLKREARQEYEKLIPEMPYIEGVLNDDDLSSLSLWDLRGVRNAGFFAAGKSSLFPLFRADNSSKVLQ